MTPRRRVVVLGAGPAGLMAALAAQRAGASVIVLAAGWGTLYWHAGCVDVLGYHPGRLDLVESPAEALAALVARQPDHPYALAGVEGVAAALDDLAAVCAEAGYPLEGSIGANVLIPTGVGGARPTCLAPATMTAGDVRRAGPTLIVGFERFFDLTPSLVADNLEHRGAIARAVTIDLPLLRSRRFVDAKALATLFERADFRHEVALALGPKLGRATRVGFPAVLGIDHATAVVNDLRTRLGVEVFEIPVVPPSIPGMRLHRILTRAVRDRGGRVYEGMEAVAAESRDRTVQAVLTAAAVRRKRTAGDAFVLATGGLLGGGIVGGHDGSLREVVFGLPVHGPQNRAEWLRVDFDDPAGHPVFRAGLVVDEQLRPVDRDGGPLLENVHVAGGALAGAEAVRERSHDGIAVATGRLAGMAATGTTVRTHGEVPA